MKIDKKQVDMITALPDEALKTVITTLGKSQGFDLSGLSATPEDLQKLRTVLRNLTDSDIGRATEIIEEAKKNRGN